MSQLHWGLLSTANINRHLIPPLRVSERNRLAAVASRSEERARAYADEWNIPEAFGSYEALLEDPNIDVIYNSLPNHLHAKWTVKAVNAGKHVLCEKPLALSAEEVDAITLAAEHADRVVAEAFMYRHHAHTLKLYELIEEQAIGELQFIRGSFSYNLSRTQDIRLNPDMGGGSLWDVGCYPLSFARYLIGKEPVEVIGHQVIGPSGVDILFAGQLHFPGDVLVQIDCGFRAPLRMNMELVGTEGAVRVPRAYKPPTSSTIAIVRDGTTETLQVEGAELYRGEVEDMADAILDGKSPRISLADSRGNVAAITALLQSAREGRPVQLT